jgi:hypothetical protein
MVAIPQVLVNEYTRDYGKSDNERKAACEGKSKDGSNVKKMIRSDTDGKKMEGIAKSLGMDETCQKAASVYSNQAVTDTDTMAGAIGLFGVGFAASATTVTDNTNDAQMMENGCGSFAVAASTIMNETANISCVLNSTLTGTVVEITQGTRIQFSTRRPTPEAQTRILESVDKLSANHTRVALKTVSPALIGNTEVALASIARLEKATESMERSILRYMELFSINADVVGSTINMALTATAKVTTDQQIEASHKTKIGESIKAIAAAACEQQMDADLGFQALGANSRQLIENRVTNAYVSDKTNIDEKITNSKTVVNSDNVIEMVIEGSVKSSEINLDAMVQTSVQTSQAVKSGIAIGQRIASELTADLLSGQSSDVDSAGFTELVEATHKGITDQIGAKGKSDADTFKGMGDGLGSVFSGLFSGMALLVLLPLLLFVGVLLFAPKLVSGFIPPQFRIPIIIGVVVLILFLVFVVFKSKSDRRRFPRSSEFMSVDDNLVDTLGYQVTTTKGRINKKPYEDFNFTAGGTWQLN